MLFSFVFNLKRVAVIPVSFAYVTGYIYVGEKKCISIF